MAQSKRRSKKSKPPLSDKQANDLTLFFLRLLIEAKHGNFIEPVGIKSGIEGTIAGEARNYIESTGIIDIENATVTSKGGGMMPNPKAKKMTASILADIKKSYSKNQEVLRVKELEDCRLRAIQNLTLLYKEYKSPNKIPDTALKYFIKTELYIENINSKLFKQASTFLKRSIKDLIEPTNNLSRGTADKVEIKNDTIRKNGLTGLAANNIDKVFQLFPNHPLNGIKVKRSNFHKIKNTNPYQTLENHLFSYSQAEICKFVLQDIFNFSESSVNGAMEILCTSKNYPKIT